MSLLRIAARRSDLARYQAYRVGEALLKAHRGLKIEYAFRESLGDKNQDDPLWKMPDRGVFTEDFVEDLVQGRCDLVVHSWKDLPIEPRGETEVVATLPRADVRDLLLLKPEASRRARAERRPLRILSSSPRRAYNLGPALPSLLPCAQGLEIRFESVRGNIPTRVAKFSEGEADGLVLAKAALDRLLTAPEAEFAAVQSELRDRLVSVDFVVLPVALNPPAAAQGALAVEIRRDRSDLREILSRIHHAETFEDVVEERRILASHGGGCHQKIGVHMGRVAGRRLKVLKGLTDAGLTLDERGLKPEFVPPRPVSASAVFPQRSERNLPVFRRSAVAYDEARLRARGIGLFVSKSEALPEGFEPAAGTLVWTAGLETWKKLVARGIFVNGSSEGLGESRPSIPWRAGTEWIKLAHEGAPSKPELPLVATYRLENELELPDLREREFFFWTSASLFERARASDPSLPSRGLHACGPGSTLEALRRAGLSESRVWVCLGYEEWLKELGLA